MNSSKIGMRSRNTDDCCQQIEMLSAAGLPSQCYGSSISTRRQLMTSSEGEMHLYKYDKNKI